MSDDLVKQSIAELQDVVRCRCHPAYKDRGMQDPDCECDSADAVQAVVDRIEELEAREEAIVKAALERAANLMLDGRAYAVEEHGERSLIVADMDARHEAIRALASDPAEVAAIIEKAAQEDQK